MTKKTFHLTGPNENLICFLKPDHWGISRIDSTVLPITKSVFLSFITFDSSSNFLALAFFTLRFEIPSFFSFFLSGNIPIIGGLVPAGRMIGLRPRILAFLRDFSVSFWRNEGFSLQILELILPLESASTRLGFLDFLELLRLLTDSGREIFRCDFFIFAVEANRNSSDWVDKVKFFTTLLHPLWDDWRESFEFLVDEGLESGLHWLNLSGDDPSELAQSIAGPGIVDLVVMSDQIAI